MKTIIYRAFIAFAICTLIVAEVTAAAADRMESGGFFALIEPAPKWVNSLNTRPSVSARKTPRGYHHELLDWQSDITGNEPYHYFHTVIVIDDKSGLHDASNISTSYNPSYETLIVHHVNLIREGKVIDKLPTARLTMARREAQLEQSVYDGMVLADLLIEDVRVGDRISYAYSVRGANPVFGPRVDTVFPLSARKGVDLLHVRVRVPRSKQIQSQFSTEPQALQISEIGDVREYALVKEQVPPLPEENDWPTWYSPVNMLQFSEYTDWQQVARWAHGLFAKEKPWSSALQEVIAGIKAPTAEGKARGALDFVQNEIRYVALAMDEGSHRPSHPNDVLTRRYGDCKDKAVLLVAMLRELGITADAALVSFRNLRNVEKWLPSPKSFDHVIVRAQIAGQVYWLDGTRSFQKGGLARRGVGDFGKALIISTDSRSLVDVVSPAESRAKVSRRQEFTFQQLSGSAKMVAESVYNGDYAESARMTFAMYDEAKIDDEVLQGIQAYYPNAKSTSSTEITDDEETNTVTVRRQYEIDEIFEQRGDVLVGAFPAMYLAPLAKAPRTTDRKAPYGPKYPVDEKQVVVLNGPFLYGIRLRPPVQMVTPYFSYSSRSELVGTRLTMEHDYHALTDVVPASEISEYASRLREMQRGLFTELSFRRSAVPPSKPSSRGPRKDVLDELKDILK